MIFQANSAKSLAGGTVRRWSSPLVALVLCAGLSGCDSIFEVENPNSLVQEDLEKAVAATAVVNGALSTVARGMGYELSVYSTASDELTWIGSRDAWGELDRGDVSRAGNEFTDAGFPFLAEGRWMADEAIKILEGHDAEGLLADRSDLAKAYIYSAMARTYIADWFDDWALSDRQVSVPPVGPDNMGSFYTTAIGYLDNALSIAQAEGDDALITLALAQRARTKHAAGVWQMLNPAGAVPGNPLVGASSGAAADALTVIGRVGGTSDWKYEFEYGATTIFSSPGWQVNQRLELRFGARYVNPLAPEEKRRESTKLEDPVDNIPDPALDAIMNAFEGSGLVNGVGSGEEYPNQTVVSAREMHLIVAESELAAGNDAGATTHINHVRAIQGGLTPFSGQISTLDMLIHSRRVNLYLQGRRLNDMYRFGVKSDNWVSGSIAFTTPGTFLPIADIEALSNTCIAIPGSC